MDAIMFISDMYLGFLKHVKAKAEEFRTNQSGEVQQLIGTAILAIITIVIAAVLGGAILPTSITTLANTSAISGYSTWSTGTQSMWGSISIFAVLSYLLVFVAIVLVLVKVAT